MKSAKIIIMLVLVAVLSSCSSEGLHFEFTIDDVSKIFSNKSAEALNSSKTIAQYEIVAIQEIRCEQINTHG